MMIRGVVAALLLGVATVAVAGCSPAEPDPDAVRAWLADEPARAADVLSVMSGKAGPDGDDRDDSDGEESDGVTIAFDTPVTVQRIEIACFGEATISIQAEISGSPTSHGAETNEIRCDRGTFSLIEDPGARNATAVRVNVSGSDVLTAWRATVHGSEG